MNKRALFLAGTTVLLTSILFIGGCALGPDYKRPETPIYEQYRGNEDTSKSIINLPWWEIYKEPELNTLVKKALENNQDIQIALARINEASALLGIARADLFPSIDISGSLNRREFQDEKRTAEDTESYTITAPVFWELDIWGKLRRSTEAAKSEMMSQEYTYRGTMIRLVADVASTYFLLLDLDNRLQISERTLESRKNSTRIINERFKKGYVAQIDLYQALIQEEDAAAAVQGFIRDIRQTENALSVLLGGLPTTVRRGNLLTLQKKLPLIPAGIPSDIIEQRPDILAAEESLHAQTARIGVAQALRLPSFSLTGAFGVQSNDLSSFNYDRDRFWSFQTDVLGPIISANRNIGRVDAEVARAEQRALEYESTILNAYREIEDTLISVQTFREEYVIRKRQAEAGRNASVLSQARYDGGATSYLEVLDIERSLFRVELSESEALRRQFTSLIDLYKALGGGWREAEMKP